MTSTTAPQEIHADLVRPPRRVGRRVVLTLGTLLPGLLAAGAAASVVSGTEGGVHRVHDSVHAVWIGLLVCVPYALQWRRAETRISLWQGLAVGSVLVVVGGGTAGVADPVFYAVFVLLAFFSWRTHPAKSALLHAGGSLSPILAPLAATACVVAVLYASDQLGMQRDFADDPHGKLTHYASQGISAMTLAAFAAVAALRTPGWQWSGGLAVAGATVWAVTSCLAPEQSGSLGTAHGLQLLALAGAFSIAMLWEHRRG